jgi:hypothetical protein
MLIVNIFFIYVTKITSSSRKEPLMITNSNQVYFAKVLGHEEGFRKGMVNFVYRFSTWITWKR